MESMPQTPDEQTRNAVTARITAHVTAGWPRLGAPSVRYRGQYCRVTARLPGHREPAPILRLRYLGSADEWANGIYKASTGQYTQRNRAPRLLRRRDWDTRARHRRDHHPLRRPQDREQYSSRPRCSCRCRQQRIFGRGPGGTRAGGLPLKVR